RSRVVDSRGPTVASTPSSWFASLCFWGKRSRRWWTRTTGSAMRRNLPMSDKRSARDGDELAGLSLALRGGGTVDQWLHERVAAAPPTGLGTGVLYALKAARGLWGDAWALTPESLATF